MRLTLHKRSGKSDAQILMAVQGQNAAKAIVYHTGYACRRLGHRHSSRARYRHNSQNGSRQIGFYWDIRLQFGIAAPFLALLRRQCCRYRHKISHQDHQGQWIIIFYPNLSLADGSSRQTSHAPFCLIVQSSPH